MAKKDPKKDAKAETSKKAKASAVEAGGKVQGGITEERFLAALNEDLAREYAAVITYRTYASLVQGQWRMELRQFFEAEIPDELLHAQLLADKIVSLGGEPTTVPASVKAAKDAHEMLSNALEDEIEAVGRYIERRKQAEDLGHAGLAIDMDDLIQDETKHRDELRMILRRWDRG